MSANRSITLRYSSMIHKESVAVDAITPGMILMYDLTALGVRKHNSAAAKVAPGVAVEADIMGKDVDAVYMIGDRVHHRLFGAGSEVNIRVVNSAPNIAIGDLLESAGDGTVRKVLTTGIPVAVALEAHTLVANATLILLRATIL